MTRLRAFWRGAIFETFVAVAGDVARGLDFYLGLAGGGNGVLVYAGEESYVRRNHFVRSWWHCS